MNEVARNEDQQPPSTILLDDVKIMWPNFAGEPGQYNAAGQRNFVVFLTREMAADFRRWGFNVKQLKQREEDEYPQDFVKVNVNFNSRQPPEVNLVNSRGRRRLDEGTAMILDWATLERSDIVVSRYQRTWPDGRTTVTPYLQTIFAFLKEDELRERYANIPEIGGNTQGEELELEGASDVFVLHEIRDEDIYEEKMRALEA